MKIRSTMSGLIHEIRVQAGRQVNPGDVVAVIESMKMLIEVNSEKAGVVKNVLCRVEDFVQEGDPLFELET